MSVLWRWPLTSNVIVDVVGEARRAVRDCSKTPGGRVLGHHNSLGKMCRLGNLLDGPDTIKLDIRDL